jgi:hypothetical protein
MYDTTVQVVSFAVTQHMRLRISEKGRVKKNSVLNTLPVTVFCRFFMCYFVENLSYGNNAARDKLCMNPYTENMIFNLRLDLSS